MQNHFQKTLKSPVQFKGVGLHNGVNVNLSLKPAGANSGITFKRTDVEDIQNIIEANYKNVNSAILCTKIEGCVNCVCLRTSSGPSKAIVERS